MDNKEQIKQYMLKLISDGDCSLPQRMTAAFGISRSTVYNYIQDLMTEGVITRKDKGYELVRREYAFSYKNDGRLSESRIYAADIEPLLKEYSKNVVSVWRYAFTEMMSNAIEHSGAENITVRLAMDGVKTSVLIDDDGKGIFERVRSYIFDKQCEDTPLCECAALLYPGRFTTDPDTHSGEGIFFTSQIMDGFFILSNNILFSRDNSFNDDVKCLKNTRGTLVGMSLENDCKRTMTEVFKRFSSADEGFTRTTIPVARVFCGNDPISRREAQWLEDMIEGFDEVELDFTGTAEIGQSFAHELFGVWQRSNPDISLNAVGTCENVDFMIKKATNTK